MSQTCCDARQYAPSEPLALHVHALSQAAQKMYICHVNRRATWQMNVRGDGGGLRQRPQVSGHNSAAIARPQAPCTFPNLQEYELNPHVFAACDTTSSDLSTHPTHDGLGLDVGERVESICREAERRNGWCAAAGCLLRIPLTSCRADVRVSRTCCS